jgi:hypothetical protein
MTEPMTQAGRKLFTDMEPMDMWESTVTPEDIVAVENEAREALRPLAKTGASRAHLMESGVLVRHNGNLWQCEAERCIEARRLAWGEDATAEEEKHR